MRKLDVEVHDTSLAIVHNGHDVAIFSFEEGDPRVHVYINERALNNNVWQNFPNLGGTPLLVEVVTFDKQEGSMSLPRPSRRQARNEVIRPASRRTRSTALVTSDTIEPDESARILRLILSSMKRHPQATKAETAAETRRIAEQCDVTVYQVAGVRANLTRGRYGKVNELVAAAR